MGAWGLFDGHRLASCFTGIVEDGLFVVWSMATRPECQGLGYGRRLLHSVLGRQFEEGVAGSLLQSSVAGQKLYRDLGYTVVEYWQLWSRPRWVMANACSTARRRLTRPRRAGLPARSPLQTGLGQEPALVELARLGEREALDQLDPVGQHGLGKPVTGGTPQSSAETCPSATTKATMPVWPSSS